MAAEVETMFYTREVPWHGLGKWVANAPSSEEALIAAGLNWSVHQMKIYTENGTEIPEVYANVRDTDGAVLGVVGSRYKVVQNRDAFAFTDALLGEGVKYETAGSLRGGKKIWLLAILPNKYEIAGDAIAPYLVFSNSHDGSDSIRVAMTPIRVVCNNTLTLALNSASRVWTARHTGNISFKLDEARETLNLADAYMKALVKESDSLLDAKLTDGEVEKLVERLFPISPNASKISFANAKKKRDDVLVRYFDAPDLKEMPGSKFKFINAVSDFASHAEPLRKTQSWQEGIFQKTIDGSGILATAYKLVA